MSDLPVEKETGLDLRAVIDALPRAVIVTDPDARIILWNQQAERLYGWAGEEVIGKAVTDVLVPASEQEGAAAILTEVSAGGTWVGDFTVARRDGTPVRIWVRDQPILDDAGTVVAIVGASEDVSDLRLMEQENAELTEHLRLALDAGRLGTFRWDRTSGEVVWDEKLEALFGLAPGTFDGTFDAYVALLHPDDRDMVLHTVEDAVARGVHYEMDHRVRWPDGSVHWLHGSGHVMVDAAGNVTGTIGCTRDVTEQVEANQQREELTRRALDLAEDERVHRERLEILTAINDALTAADDREQVMANVVRAAVPAWADWCSLHVLGEGSAPDVAIAHADPTKADYAQALRELNPYDPEAPRGIPKVIRTGEPDFFPVIDDAALDEIEASEELRRVVADLGLRSGIQVPLLKRGRIVGALQLVMTESRRRYTDDDFTLAQAVAARVASTLENRRLAQEQREIASALQASLLPNELPAVPGIEMAVRYWANGDAVEVGGDFYDAFPIDEHTWGLVIGDVCGTGPKAAGITGLARHTIASSAWHGDDHRAVLRNLNTTLRRRNADTFCSALYATITTGADGAFLEFASAGHPLPVLVTASGEASTVGAPGQVAGLFDEIDLTMTSLPLRSGDSIVLYTDGATDVAPPHGLTPEQLEDLVRAAATGAPHPDEIADEIEARLSAILPIADRRDDIAILVLTVT